MIKHSKSSILPDKKPLKSIRRIYPYDIQNLENISHEENLLSHNSLVALHHTKNLMEAVSFCADVMINELVQIIIPDCCPYNDIKTRHNENHYSFVLSAKVMSGFKSEKVFPLTKVIKKGYNVTDLENVLLTKFFLCNSDFYNPNNIGTIEDLHTASFRVGCVNFNLATEAFTEKFLQQYKPKTMQILYKALAQHDSITNNNEKTSFLADLSNHLDRIHSGYTIKKTLSIHYMLKACDKILSLSKQDFARCAGLGLMRLKSVKFNMAYKLPNTFYQQLLSTYIEYFQDRKEQIKHIYKSLLAIKRFDLSQYNDFERNDFYKNWLFEISASDYCPVSYALNHSIKLKYQDISLAPLHYAVVQQLDVTKTESHIISYDNTEFVKLSTQIQINPISYYIKHIDCKKEADYHDKEEELAAKGLLEDFIVRIHSPVISLMRKEYKLKLYSLLKDKQADKNALLKLLADSENISPRSRSPNSISPKNSKLNFIHQEVHQEDFTYLRLILENIDLCTKIIKQVAKDENKILNHAYETKLKDRNIIFNDLKKLNYNSANFTDKMNQVLEADHHIQTITNSNISGNNSNIISIKSKLDIDLAAKAIFHYAPIDLLYSMNKVQDKMENTPKSFIRNCLSCIKSLITWLFRCKKRDTKHDVLLFDARNEIYNICAKYEEDLAKTEYNNKKTDNVYTNKIYERFLINFISKITNTDVKSTASQNSLSR